MRLNIRQLPAAMIITLGLIAILVSGNANAELDLQNAAVEHLDNGLTVIILADRNFPVVSVQMLYRVGARDEVSGKTGLAHFLEHMAFRDSENFPDTGLVSSIYATGGEWHGYTWTDQTTYFATVPKEHLDLLLQIEADRMSRLTIARSNMEPERGAVLAEMHMYENDPSSMLTDAIVFTSFLAHPYRNNTIGWESDIDNLQHEDVVSFYEQHYHPANGVLVVVGDIDRNNTIDRINELFGEFEKSKPTPLPVTVEPLQDGERRITLHGNAEDRQFMIGYRAPSANNPDFAPFLVLQELLGGGSGISFLQNDWGTPVRDSSLLAGAADGLTTWYPPSAQDYVFVIGGSAAAQFSESVIEDEIENRVATVRLRPVNEATLAAAISRTLDEFVFDVETTEDAAHQLAFFEGLNALDKFLELPQQISSVTAGDVQRVAQTWLKPQRRTIAWHLPREAEANAEMTALETERQITPNVSPLHSIDDQALPVPSLQTLGGGIAVIIQPSDVSKSAAVKIIFQGGIDGVGAAANNSPISDYSAVTYRRRSDQFDRVINDARLAVENATVVAVSAGAVSQDPETRLEQSFDQTMSAPDSMQSGPAVPALIVVSGDVNAEAAFSALEKSFGTLEFSYRPAPQIPPIKTGELRVELGIPVAQAQLGYAVSAPAPREPAYDAVRILQYILSHGYEGRLGKEAIAKRGLAYYIDSRYRSDGTNGWITLGIGVDPQKIEELRSLMREELQRLNDDPPTVAEFEEAKAYLRGRARSAAQSNEELANALARQWLWHGDTSIADSLERRLETVAYSDVLEQIPAFINGLTIVVAQ